MITPHDLSEGELRWRVGAGANKPVGRDRVSVADDSPDLDVGGSPVARRSSPRHYDPGSAGERDRDIAVVGVADARRLDLPVGPAKLAAAASDRDDHGRTVG